MENDEKIVINKNGQEVECDILFTFDCDDNGKSYIGYTDHSFGDNGRKNIYVSSYNPIMGPGTLEDITEKEELDMLQDVLQQIEKGEV